VNGGGAGSAGEPVGGEAGVDPGHGGSAGEGGTALWEKNGERVSRIGKRLFLDSATLTPLLKRLEARGFVERRRSARDERVVEVFLTRAGKRLERRAGELSEAVFCKASMPLSALSALRDTLRVLTKNLHAAEEKKAG